VHGSGALLPLDGTMQRSDAPFLDVIYKYIKSRFIELDYVHPGGSQFAGLIVYYSYAA
jgi:hypothetical protein